MNRLLFPLRAVDMLTLLAGSSVEVGRCSGEVRDIRS